MKAMVLRQVRRLEGDRLPLVMEEIPDPVPAEREILVQVSTCGVCHTELDEIEGRTPPSCLPVIPGHQVIGRVIGSGTGAKRFRTGDRVGFAWIYSACGTCRYCREGRENLCDSFRATGRDADGGYAEQMSIPEDFAYPIPEVFSDLEAAPLLCAGAIGYRSLRLTGLQEGQILGLIGFGASAHLLLKMILRHLPEMVVYVFARSEEERNFARELGATWAGEIEEDPPGKLDGAIDTTPVWKPVIEGMRHLRGGGRMVINAIRKEERDREYLLHLDYPTHLWLEKEIKSVANVTRRDVEEFLKKAAEVPIRPEVRSYPLEQANEALVELKTGRIRGAKVLQIGDPSPPVDTVPVAC